MGVMTTNATIDSKLVRAIADEQLANNVFMIEWLVKAQQQLSLQQRLIDQQQQQISTQQQEIEKLKEERDKLKNRNSKNSSVPPSSDQLKKPSDKKKRKKGFKRGPKYDHLGKTRNGFGQPDKIVPLELENCPVCGGSVERDEVVPEKVQQVAEVVDQPIEIREYRRGFYKCPSCGWSDYS
ncbi:DUF6444 domain-containing protein, partial [Crocosphaera watsonii]